MPMALHFAKTDLTKTHSPGVTSLALFPVKYGRGLNFLWNISCCAIPAKYTSFVVWALTNRGRFKPIMQIQDVRHCGDDNEINLFGISLSELFPSAVISLKAYHHSYARN